MLVPPELFHLLFVKFVFSINSAVIRCHAGVGSADLGSLYGAIFIKFVCSFGSAPHTRSFSSAKETNTADTVKLPRK